MALRLNEGLGLAPCGCLNAGRKTCGLAESCRAPTAREGLSRSRAVRAACRGARLDVASRLRVAFRVARRRPRLSLLTVVPRAQCGLRAKRTLVPRCARGAFPEKGGVAIMVDLRGLTFELSWTQRWDARPGLAKMYRVPPDRAWWPAVGAQLERGVRRHCTPWAA